MHKRNPRQNTQSGFTLIETLVAIFILLISVTGPMSFAQSGLRASFVARDQVVAFYLAQDAIETIKNARDNASLNSSLDDGSEWLDGIDFECVSNSTTDLDKPCEMQSSIGGVLNDRFMLCGGLGGLCNPMKFDTTEREFLLNGESGIASKFTRTVYINKIVANREAQIIVEVSWDTQFLSKKSIVVQENIYNWVPQNTQ